jgi:hypothetical protein
LLKDELEDSLIKDMRWDSTPKWWNLDMEEDPLKCKHKINPCNLTKESPKGGVWFTESRITLEPNTFPNAT